ncbi:MAG TPA: hypothetical protein VFD48_17890, partial [Pyrinomonadaceae bacterium]|nr:hypothetical protein [Pyrinomonadaceae bacterium]
MRTLKNVASFTFAVLLLFGIGGNTFAQTEEVKKQTPEVDQLKERLQQLEDTVRELKGQINALEEDKAPKVVEATYSTPPPTQPAEPAPPKPQDSKGESTFEVYGFAMLDAGYQFKQNDPDWFDVVRPTKLPSFPNEFAPNGNTYFGVRQSRLGVRGSTPTQFGELKTQFE